MSHELLPGEIEWYENELRHANSVQQEFIDLTIHWINSDMNIEKIVDLMGNLIEAYDQVQNEMK